MNARVEVASRQSIRIGGKVKISAGNGV
jgi:hypothetical protein